MRFTFHSYSTLLVLKRSCQRPRVASGLCVGTPRARPRRGHSVPRPPTPLPPHGPLRAVVRLRRLHSTAELDGLLLCYSRAEERGAKQTALRQAAAGWTGLQDSSFPSRSLASLLPPGGAHFLSCPGESKRRCCHMLCKGCFRMLGATATYYGSISTAALWRVNVTLLVLLRSFSEGHSLFLLCMLKCGHSEPHLLLYLVL